MRSPLRLQFATRKSGLSGDLPFIERCENQNDYIKERLDAAHHSVVLTDQDPDFLIILNRLNYDLPHPKSRTIGVVTEPTWSKNMRPEYLNERCALVISHSPDHLNNPVHGHSLCVPWVTSSAASIKPVKHKKLSIIASPLNTGEAGTNYEFRHNLIQAILATDLDCDIYGDWPGTDSRLKGVVSDKTEALLPYEFSIAIENSCEPGYSTEKLIDCFLTETQPVYLGDCLAKQHYGEKSLILLSKEQPLDTIRHVLDGTIAYCADAVRAAKTRYLNSYNLLSQVTSAIESITSSGHRQYGNWRSSLNMDSIHGSKAGIVQSLASRPSSLLITGSVNDELIEILGNAGLMVPHADGQGPSANDQVSSNVELDFNRVANTMDQEPPTHLLLFYNRPESLLAEALKSGKGLESAIRDWQQHAQSVLELFRKHRRRTTLIDLDAVTKTPDLILDGLSKRLLLDLENSVDQALSHSLSMSEGSDQLANLIARCAVQEHPEMRLKAAELEASNAFSYSVDALNLVEELTRFRDELQDKHSENQEVKDENELLTLQLSQVQEELEYYFTHAQDLDKRLDKTSQLLAKTERRLKDTWQNLRNTRAISRRRRKELGELGTSLKTLEQDQIASMAQSENRRLTIEAMRQSISWKLTTPIRVLLGWLRIGRS